MSVSIQLVREQHLRAVLTDCSSVRGSVQEDRAATGWEAWLRSRESQGRAGMQDRWTWRGKLFFPFLAHPPQAIPLQPVNFPEVCLWRANSCPLSMRWLQVGGSVEELYVGFLASVVM